MKKIDLGGPNHFMSPNTIRLSAKAAGQFAWLHVELESAREISGMVFWDAFLFCRYKTNEYYRTPDLQEHNHAHA